MLAVGCDSPLRCSCSWKLYLCCGFINSQWLVASLAVDKLYVLLLENHWILARIFHPGREFRLSVDHSELRSIAPESEDLIDIPLLVNCQSKTRQASQVQAGTQPTKFDHINLKYIWGPHGKPYRDPYNILRYAISVHIK